MSKNDMHKILNSPELEPPADLKVRILQNIKMAEQKKMQERLLVLKIAIALTLVAVILGVYFGISQFIKSEFWSASELVFSDFNTIISKWNIFLWYLLETLPVLPILLTFTPIVMLMILIREYSRRLCFEDKSCLSI